MAPRKKRTLILERDPAFTKTIGSSSNDKPDPLGVAIAEANSRIQAEYPDGEPEPVARSAVGSPVPRPKPKPMKETDTPAIGTVTSAIPSEAEQPASPETTKGLLPTQRDAASDTVQEDGKKVGEEEGAQPVQQAQAETRNAGEADTHVEVRVSMLVHSDLAKRAETWGKSMGLSGVTVLRQSFAKLKPELMAELKTLKAGDVHMERAESVGPRIQSLLRFSAADYAEMQARLDPARFGILASMLNYHARARFSSFLDKLLTDAGY